MPWSIERRNGEFCVIKDGTGENEGCHETRDEAVDQIRALNAAEADQATQRAVDADLRENDHTRDMQVIASDLRRLADQLVSNLPAEEVPNSPSETSVHPDDEKEEEPVFDIEVPDASIDFVPWQGVLTLEDQFTGDGRKFLDGAVVWNEALLPFPFKWQRVSANGHDASVTIGRVDHIERREDGVIFGRGVILQGEKAPVEADEYIGLLEVDAAGGVSIDGDDAEFEVIVNEETESIQLVFSRINIRALTAVDIPAFAGAKIELTDSVVAAVIGATNLPVAARARDYDGLAAQKRIFAWAASDGENQFDQSKLARAFLWRDSDGNPDEKGSYKLPFTDLVDGTLTIIPKAVFAAAGAVEGARGGLNVPSSEKPAIRRRITTLYGKIEPVEGEEGHPTPPWETNEGDSSANTVEFNREDRPREDAENLVASAIPVNPPADWFTEPKFEALTPITITDDGHVFGHLCGKETCHIGFGTCRTSPRNCDYDLYFHLGEIPTDDGGSVNVGHMTFRGGHAPLELGAQAAADAYDSTSRVSADIRAGEDEFGTWIVGALRPGLSDEDIREIRSAPLSGDWRSIKGKLQLIAAHAVNVPGFPIPRAKVLVESGITASIIISEECDCDLDTEFQTLIFDIEMEEIDE